MFVGLSGQIGAGKSLASQFLLKYDDVVLHSSDDLSKKALNTIGLDFVRNRYGDQYIVNDLVNTQMLAKLVFATGNENELRDLEKYLHPIVEKWIQNNYKKNKINVVESAILFECRWDKWMDYIIYMTCHLFDRRKRLYSRGMTDETINQMIKLQSTISTKEKIKLSTYHVDNTLGIDVLERRIDLIVSDLREKK